MVLLLVEVTAASVHCMTMTFEGLSNAKLRDLVLVLDKRTIGQIFAGGVVEDDCESVTYCGHRPMERTWYLETSVFSSFFFNVFGPQTMSLFVWFLFGAFYR